MLLAIDSGNTNIVLAVFDNASLQHTWRISSRASYTADEFGLLVTQLLQTKSIPISAIKDVIISNVVPKKTYALGKFCKEYIGRTPMMVGQKDVVLGIEVLVKRPGEVGADRLVNAVAAYKRYAKAAIIIDFGTATTFDVIAPNGAYIGGVIAPGVDLSLQALHNAAAKLPDIEVKKPSSVLGTNTVEAMQSGIYYGYLGLIEGIVQRLKASHSESLVIATGGLSSLYAEESGFIDHHEADLTLWGLYDIYQMNVKERL